MMSSVLYQLLPRPMNYPTFFGHEALVKLDIFAMKTLHHVC